MSLSASCSGTPATRFLLATSLAGLASGSDALRQAQLLRAGTGRGIGRCPQFGPTSCIQATSIANAAMMMQSGKQNAINTNIAPGECRDYSSAC